MVLSEAGWFLFGLLMLAVAVKNLADAQPDGILRVIGSILIAGLGARMLFAPVLAYRDAERTVYAITELRLIIARKDGKELKSINLSGIREVDRLMRDGRVTLRIPTGLVSDGDGGKMVAYTELHGLTDGERPYRLLTGQITARA